MRRRPLRRAAAAAARGRDRRGRGGISRHGGGADAGPHPRGQRLHRQRADRAHPADDRLARLGPRHRLATRSRPSSTTRASRTSRATSRSTRSGSSTRSRSATSSCRSSRSRRRRRTSRQPLAVFELDFEENLRIVKQAVRYRQARRLPVDLRGLRDVPGRRVRRGRLAARLRADPEAALDLLVQQAAARPRDLGVRRRRGCSSRSSARSTGSARTWTTSTRRRRARAAC